MEKLLLTVGEAAVVLGVGKSRVYDLMRLRQLRSVKIGRTRRVPVDCLREYVERLTAEDHEVVP